MSQPALVRAITQLGDAKIGLNFLDIAPPPSPVGAQTKTIGIVGHFPWGPQNDPILCISAKDFFSTFHPPAFGPPDTTTHPAFKALLVSRIPGPFYVVNINPTAVADVAMVLSYTVSGGSWQGTAAYPGTLGNAITATWAAATDADAAKRNLTIAIGTTYSILYENVTTTTILTLANPYITWTATSTPAALPAAAASATTTTAGVDGTAAASDYVGTSLSNVGIRMFYTTAVDWLFVAECPSALINAVNTGLVAYGTGGGLNGGYVLCSVASQTAAAAITYVASYRDTTSKGVYVWPRPSVVDQFDPDFAAVTVDGNALAACTYAGVDAWKSPEWSNSAPYLTVIADLVPNDAAPGTLDLLSAAGISMFYLDPTIGPMLGSAVVTNIVSGSTRIKRTKYRKYADDKIATLTPYYQGQPLDVDLATQTLGEYSDGLVSAITAFFEDEKAKGHIAAYSVDPFGSNTSDDLEANQWTIAVAVQLYGDISVLIITTQIGSTVNISTPA